MADREKRSVQPTLDELEQGLLINEHKLEVECSRHADVFYRVAKRVALETSRRDALKQSVAETEAEVDLDYRRVAEKANEKPREKAIESEMLLDSAGEENQRGIHAGNAPSAGMDGAKRSVPSALL